FLPMLAGLAASMVPKLVCLITKKC
uniref:Brevinin-1La n=1 Tax=Rana luteiventris TaxID=58176 RepID=BR1A_RANLU|nr:RecName: Full=Brevinin-1La [Rana luteiventris]